jgi:hypothetical protein
VEFLRAQKLVQNYNFVQNHIRGSCGNKNLITQIRVWFPLPTLWPLQLCYLIPARRQTSKSKGREKFPFRNEGEEGGLLLTPRPHISSTFPSRQKKIVTSWLLLVPGFIVTSFQCVSHLAWALTPQSPSPPRQSATLKLMPKAMPTCQTHKQHLGGGTAAFAQVLLLTTQYYDQVHYTWKRLFGLSGSGLPAGRVSRWGHKTSHSKRQWVWGRGSSGLSLFFIKPPVYSHGVPILMTLSHPNYFSKIPPLNTIVKLSFHLLNTSQWRLDFNLNFQKRQTTAHHSNTFCF